MSLVLNVEILGEFKKLTSATQGAQSELQSMTKRASSASKAITRSFAAIGVGLSFRFIANELEDAAKAAIEDVKSQELLANALRNTMGATDDQIASVEGVIKKYQFATSVADDQLRPAYQKLALATKDTTKANELLGLALDVAAGTGKGLDVVSQALAKSLAGSDTALLKLIPSLKGSKTPLDDLAKAFGGAAEKAANTDPYQRMQIVFGELQEQVGMALLPALEKFSAWVASPEGQAKLQGFVELITGLAGKFEILVGWAIENADALINWSTAIATAGIAIKVLSTGLGIYNTVAATVAARNAAVAASQTAVGTTAATAAVGVRGLYASLGLIAGIAGTVALVLSLKGDTAPTSTGPNTQLRDNNGQIIPTLRNAPLTVPQAPVSGNLSTGNIKFGRQSFQPTEVNININKATVDGADVVDALDKYYSRTGAQVAY
jgi:hypothetical protein